MSFFVNGIVKVVPIDDNNSVTVRKFSTGQRQNIVSKSTKISASTQDVVVDPGAMRMAQLLEGLVGWHGPEFDGLPCKPENITALDPAIADVILTAIDEFNTQLSIAEKKI